MQITLDSKTVLSAVESGIKIRSTMFTGDTFSYDEIKYMLLSKKDGLRRVTRHLLLKPYGPGVPFECLGSHNAFYRCVNGEPLVEICRDFVWPPEKGDGERTVILNRERWCRLIREQKALINFLVDIKECDVDSKRKLVNRLVTPYA